MSACDRCGDPATRVLILGGSAVRLLCTPCWEEPFLLQRFALVIDYPNDMQRRIRLVGTEEASEA